MATSYAGKVKTEADEYYENKFKCKLLAKKRFRTPAETDTLLALEEKVAKYRSQHPELPRTYDEEVRWTAATGDVMKAIVPGGIKIMKPDFETFARDRVAISMDRYDLVYEKHVNLDKDHHRKEVAMPFKLSDECRALQELLSTMSTDDLKPTLAPFVYTLPEAAAPIESILGVVLTAVAVNDYHIRLIMQNMRSDDYIYDLMRQFQPERIERLSMAGRHLSSLGDCAPFKKWKDPALPRPMVTEIYDRLKRLEQRELVQAVRSYVFLLRGGSKYKMVADGDVMIVVAASQSDAVNEFRMLMKDCNRTYALKPDDIEQLSPSGRHAYHFYETLHLAEMYNCN